MRVDRQHSDEPLVRQPGRIRAVATSILRFLFPPIERTSNSRLVYLLRLLLVLVYILVISVASIVITELYRRSAERHVVAWAVAGIFVAIAVPLPLNDILMHGVHYVRPTMQRYYIRILWLVPIYSIQSWLALRFYPEEVYFATARELYEAFVLWSFYSMLLEFFPSRDALIALLLKKGQIVKPMFPLCYMRPWKSGRPFIRTTSFGVLQYVLVRVTLTCITFVMLLAAPSAYGEGEFGNPAAAYVYIITAMNVSQIWAMYCLVSFYHELAEDMATIRPLSKFLSIKALVFLTFWQSIVISGLNFAGVIPHTVEWSDTEVANGLQDFLICIEMALFACAHRFYFSYKDFESEFKILGPGAPRLDLVALDMLPIDIALEAGRHASVLFGGKNKALLSGHPGASERESSLGDFELTSTVHADTVNDRIRSSLHDSDATTNLSPAAGHQEAHAVSDRASRVDSLLHRRDALLVSCEPDTDVISSSTSESVAKLTPVSFS